MAGGWKSDGLPPFFISFWERTLIIVLSLDRPAVNVIE